MPYISRHDREFLDDQINELVEAISAVPSQKTGGALNYAICRLAIGSQEPRGYTEISNMLGHIRSAETEMRRRLLDTYEDKCILENGDLKEFDAPQVTNADII